MRKLFTVLAAVLMFQAAAVAAEERVDHYKFASPETRQEAMTLLNEKMAAIDELIKAEELDFVTLENIHEISYALEAAVDKLRAESVKGMDPIDEAVQALHYASENQDGKVTREWFAKLKPLVSGLEAAAADTAKESGRYEVVIKDHKFSPESMAVPAGQKIKLLVRNLDPTPEEFESHDFNREKIIAGNSEATIFIGPLKPGKYHYFGEFNMATANGYIIAE